MKCGSNRYYSDALSARSCGLPKLGTSNCIEAKTSGWKSKKQIKTKFTRRTQWFTLGQLRTAIIYQLSWDGLWIGRRESRGGMGTWFLEACAEWILIFRISFRVKQNLIVRMFGAKNTDFCRLDLGEACHPIPVPEGPETSNALCRWGSLQKAVFFYVERTNKSSGLAWLWNQLRRDCVKDRLDQMVTERFAWLKFSSISFNCLLCQPLICENGSLLRPDWCRAAVLRSILDCFRAGP